MTVERLQPKGLPDSEKIYQYAQAVRAGNLLFVSGQTGWNAEMKTPESYEDEIRQLFENLKLVLAEAGCGFEDVVDVTSYHTPGADIGSFWRVRNEYFTAPYPAWTLIQDIALVSPDLHAEVKVNAVIP